MLYFNANDSFYKNPKGAVESEKEIRFRIGVSHSDGVFEAYIFFSEDGKEAVRYQMKYETQNDNVEYYVFTCPPQTKGIYWYTFLLKTQNGDFVYGRGELGAAEKDNLSAFQQTVYSKHFSVPKDFTGKIIYQIFPDRFNKTEKYPLPERKNYVKYKNPDELPNYIREENGDLDTTDFFGGTLKGIEEKLDYIKSLGASVIYLNPIFEAHSNHRYDTADYMNIDPVLGTEKDFSSLCKKAEEKGIKIILDGVFSHTGDDSIYFNKYNTFDNVGAYQSETSPYYSWYTFQEYPDRYSAWWGIKILPEVNEENPDYLEYITGKNGVLEKWLSLGASGFRLDVADELPDGFLDALYKRVKETKENSYVVGEVWEDATNKEGFGKRRKYLLGHQMDGVMNYVLKNAVINYLTTGNARAVAKAQNLLSENYPAPALNSLMNILGSHDTKRIISVLGGYSSDDKDFESQANEKLSEEKRGYAKKLLKIGYFLMTCLPGCPTIYYGDEIGMEGLSDPLNRKYFDWENGDTEIRDFYALCGKIRNENEDLQISDYNLEIAGNSLFAFSRGKFFAVSNAGPLPDRFFLKEDRIDLFSGKKYSAGDNTVDGYGFLLLKREEI